MEEKRPWLKRKMPLVSAITFGSLVNWPPFDPSDPSKAYTPRLQGLLELLGLNEHEAFGSFKGLKNAEALVVGSLRGIRMRPEGEIKHRVLYLHGCGPQEANDVAVLKSRGRAATSRCYTAVGFMSSWWT